MTADNIISTVLTGIFVTLLWFVQIKRHRRKARGQKLEKNQIARTQRYERSNTVRRVEKRSDFS